MSDLSTTLTDKEIQQIAEKDDFHIAPYRADGETFGTPTWIWVVETDGELFVRAYNGISSRWYQSAKEQKERGDTLEGPVRRRPVETIRHARWTSRQDEGSKANCRVAS